MIKQISDVSWGMLPSVFAIVAALIVSRQPRNLIGWLMLGPTILAILSGLVDSYLGQFQSAPTPTFPILLMTWFQNWSWLTIIFPLFFILLLFPTGKPVSSRWRWVLIYGAGMAVFFILLVTFTRVLRETNGKWAITNPIGFISDGFFSNIFPVPWVSSLLLLTIASATSLFVRYRRTSPVERLQIKWLLFSSGMFAIFYTLTAWQSDAQGIGRDIIDLLLSLSIFLFPISIAVAILRYRLWDIDVIIRKTLIYATLTALLGLIFFGGVVFLQRSLTLFIGTQNSPLVVVVSTLMIAALFTPLRSRIQDFIDRRFFRKKYNAERILEKFAASIRDEVEMEQLTEHLLSAVEETVQPESVRLWLKTEKSYKL